MFEELSHVDTMISLTKFNSNTFSYDTRIIVENEMFI